MSIEIKKLSEEYIDGFHVTLDAVAREKKYLSRTEAPPIERMRQWVRGNIEKGIPQFVAVADEIVVGWCDIIPNNEVGFQHVGSLGMGVVPPCRHQGIGTRLLRAVLAAARAFGLERIELEVFASNRPAITLYSKHGFVEEGRKVKARKLAGTYDDKILMARFL